MGSPDTSLQTAVRTFVAAETGDDLATGPIRLLTQPRSFGWYFSPLSLYFCYAANDQLRCVVAEVNNTPWGEQHCYVLWQANRVAPPGKDKNNEAASGSSPARHAYSHAKRFHVSPFMPMDQTYHWCLSDPRETLDVQLGVSRDGRRYFDAGMSLIRRPLSARALAGQLVRSPVSAARLLVAIYYQALRLWMKRCPYFPHPKNQPATTPAA